MTNDNETLEKILQKLTKLDTIEKQLSNLEVKIDTISLDLQTHKNDTAIKINDLQCQINALKLENNIMAEKSAQDKIKLDVMCFGLPTTYHDKRDEIIDSFNRSFGLNLTLADFTRIRTSATKAPQTSLRMSFIDIKSKNTFMKAVDTVSRGNDGKRHPLVVEDIFEELKHPPNILCGKTISFSNSLTKMNQQLIKMKKGVKPHILFERSGQIYIKKDKDSQPLEINTVSQVREYVAEFGRNNQ